MQKTFVFNNVRSTPKKIRETFRMVKTDSLITVQEKLQNINRKSARMLLSTLKTASVNAQQTLKLPIDMLELKALSVGDGLKLKRYQPASRGMAKPYHKKFAHIRITIGQRKSTLPAVEEVKTEPNTKDKTIQEEQVQKKPDVVEKLKEKTENLQTK